MDEAPHPRPDGLLQHDAGAFDVRPKEGPAIGLASGHVGLGGEVHDRNRVRLREHATYGFAVRDIHVNQAIAVVEMRQPRRVARVRQRVEADDLAAFRQRAANGVAPEESGRAGDQQPLAAHLFFPFPGGGPLPLPLPAGGPLPWG